VSSQVAKISALSSTAPPWVIHSVTDHNGLLKLLAVTGLDSLFMVTTARSAVSPKSQFGPVVIPESKLNINAQRPPAFYAVVSAEDTILHSLLPLLLLLQDSILRSFLPHSSAVLYSLCL